ncbi:MAG: putative Ig domain-containing protein, partial [Bacteroidales bacterium]
MKIFYQISKSFVQSTLSLFSGAFQAQTNRTAMTKKSTQHCVKQLLLCLLVCMGTIATNAQSWPTTAPVISYAGPQYYNQNVTITPLLPSNSNAGSIPGNYPFAVNTLVGTGTAGKVDGTSTASFSLPTGIAKDGNGNLYIADAKNNLIRKITKAGVVITLAGDGYKNVLGVGRLLAGNGTAASFDHPTGLVVVGDTCIYVADNNNNVIRKIRLTSPYAVTTFAGFLNGSAGSVDATGNAAKFSSPQDITVDAAGNLYVVDNGNNKIRKITTAGAVTSFAGSGTAGNKDSTGILATFKAPTGIAIDAAGNLYIADNGNNKIRKITAAGVVTSYAGIGIAYTQDGVGLLSYFNGPESVTIDKYNNLYVTEDGNYVRKVTPAGVVTTIAGTGVASSVDSTVGKLATFNQPAGIAIDAVGDTLYIADTKGNIIRTISLTGYSITPALPAGLSFNGATGTISGTPTVLSSMSSYLVTGTNAVGSDTATVSIKVCAATNSTDTMIIKSNKLPYSWDGLTFTAAGTQTAHFINAAGCDSAAIHTLIIISCATSSSTTILLKPSQLPYSWNGL